MSENKTWKQERPVWCPHPDCLFVKRAMDATCVGHLPKPEPHDGDENIHRWCLNGAADNGGVFDLQINNTDLWWFRLMFSALDGKAVEQSVQSDDATHCECGEVLDIDGMCPDIANDKTHRR